METIAKTQVYNLVILDKSGSMESIRKESIDGYNETLGTIRAAQTKHGDTQEQFVSLAAFCGCGIEMIYDKTPIDKAEKLTREKYEPCCVTPLFDAIGSSIKKLKNDIKDIEDAAVLVTIITDGYENASKEWTAAAIKRLIDECKKDGWMFAFIGAILTMLLVFRVARIATSRSITGILLAGIACSSMLTAAITLLMMWNRQKLEQIYLWMLGSFSAATWVKVGFMAIVLAGAVICFAFLGRDLDLLSFGDQEAQSMGVSVKRTRTTAVIATSLLVAASVSVSGIIGFVSLIIPHIMRLLVGPKNRRLIPLSLLGGAIFMILCDLVSRTAAPPAEIAVGAITQVTGAPFFLYLLWKERRKEERE